ncbi:Inosine/uridine-preferring nucleoside hydrolase [Oleidesulfovibrio alaskensis G20]|uniref:Inosine/uridine-preferring nucleoside hydrolase n=1 Tax=Oleidesulfovibrio alaskensis (strain ATCC BAA-1058 / DSM 17464 / G20) TaxID=207559 RepID=Q314T5_OLEA2|nr:nucleoside hydrolase [Oleidesulfovibrio alaskensis]ABB37561.1 Inosine/uridine-preferring nucleoside hydrolase [Oleidesulfovibrio alaskensis G20]MBG0773150.1 nucleoside hydrolase [Oleidesulfovibrio alaskensis]
MTAQHNDTCGAACPPPLRRAEAPVKVLLDIDNAMGLPVRDADDGVALALALWSPEFELTACTTCSGNCRASASAQNTLRMLELAGADAVPVAAGTDTPLGGEDRARHHAFLDAKASGAGASLWDDVSLPAPSARQASAPACRLIIETVRRHPHEVVLVMEGALTNLALALRHASDIAPLIGAVVHMGGVFAPRCPEEMAPQWKTPDIPEYVWRHALRFNTWYDPQATEEVVRAGLPLCFVPVNVTSRTCLSSHQIAQMRTADDPLRCFVRRTLLPWARWSEQVRGLDGAHMHDALALAVAAMPHLCSWKPFCFDVQAFRDGRDFLLPFGDKPYHRVWVATAVDAAAFHAWLLATMGIDVSAL